MTQHTKAEVILQVKDVALTYDRPILRDINLSIRNIVRPGFSQGQVVTLIGRSGIGKTQLFKILSGLQAPTSGQVTIHGNQPVKAGDMGVIFQNYYLFEWRTVYQSLMLAAKKNKVLAGMEKQTIEQYAHQFQLTGHLILYPRQLSGGQRQRVSIMQQLLKGSNFILLDEPFSGLDVCMLDKAVELLLQVSLSDELKTLIIVSHDIETSVAISDTVFILGTEPNKAGATIKKEIDLIERDLAWQKNIKQERRFLETLEEIKADL
ncbi:ABC transporter ATP-binding protein [Longitalea luteola]|uniref:ABC transporter ATP-binding protein n=1 Tax=Longitalea luteola TaxID=2812563 RepID=UPI001A95E2F8|nr:ATP-binding cassette domain-containing protein [Longitalea luteola]